MTESKNKELKQALYAVILGYSIATLDDKKVFIKHFGPRDKVEVDYQYEIAYQSAISKNVITSEEKEKQLIVSDIWSEERNKEIMSLELSIEALRKRKRYSLPSQIKEINKQISDSSLKVSKLKTQKYNLMGVTAESIAQRRAEDFYIATSFMRDDLLKNRLIDPADFDDMDISMIDSMKIAYFRALTHILGENIKRISILKEFMNLMYLAEKPFEILNKALVDYTFFQIDLISFGRHYKHILTNDPPPPQEIMEDADQLDDWFDSSNTMRKIASKNNNKESLGRATTIMGGTKEDLEMLKGEGDIVNLDTEIKKAAKNGPLNMEQMMKLHGIR